MFFFVFVFLHFFTHKSVHMGPFWRGSTDFRKERRSYESDFSGPVVYVGDNRGFTKSTAWHRMKTDGTPAKKHELPSTSYDSLKYLQLYVQLCCFLSTYTTNVHKSHTKTSLGNVRRSECYLHNLHIVTIAF